MTASSPLLRAAAGLSLLLAAAGCASQSSGMHSQRPAAASGRAASSGGIKSLAAAYLAIAEPANHQLDQEVDGYDDHAHDNLAAAESALRAQAATERRFDQQLLKIQFPPPIAATARALVQVNQHRIDLTELQAQSATVAGLLSFTAAHRAADAAVEAQVRIIRRQLGLPPPANS